MTVQQLQEILSSMDQNATVLIGREPVPDADCGVEVSKYCDLVLIENGYVTLDSSRDVQIFIKAWVDSLLT